MSDERTFTHAGRELVVRNLSKVFWPDDGLTKGDLIAYYETLAPTIVPHLHTPAIHHEAVSERDRGQAFLPEERPQTHAGLDRDASVRHRVAGFRRAANDRIPTRQ